jgi:hypothetical protein
MDFEGSATCLATFKSDTFGVINLGWFSQDNRIGVELFGSVKYATTYTHVSKSLCQHSSESGNWNSPESAAFSS